VDEQAAERVVVLHDVDIPTVLDRRGKELSPRRPDIPRTGPGEEVQVLGRTRRQSLRQQRPSPSQQKPPLAGRPKKQLRELNLKHSQATAVRASHYATTGTSRKLRT
jgi:hypothetical protein